MGLAWLSPFLPLVCCLKETDASALLCDWLMQAFSVTVQRNPKQKNTKTNRKRFDNIITRLTEGIDNWCIWTSLSNLTESDKKNNFFLFICHRLGKWSAVTWPCWIVTCSSDGQKKSYFPTSTSFSGNRGEIVKNRFFKSNIKNKSNTLLANFLLKRSTP